MNLVYIIQSGDDGHVSLGTATDRGLHRKIAALQRGNPEVLAIRHLYDGDERLERELHVRWTSHRYRGDWYHPAALEDLPDVPELHHDDNSETRRRASLELADLARSNPGGT